MGFYSYDGGSRRGGFMSMVPKATKNLIIINALVMLMTFINEPLMVRNFALYLPTSPFWKWWQPVTHMFMHDGFFHLFFNMYTLFIFGSVLERVWGPKKFLLFYFVTGIGAALVHMGVQWWQYSSGIASLGEASIAVNDVAQMLFIPTVGASGAIYGVLMGYAMLYPDSIMSLMFPPISMKAKWFVLIFAGIELLLGISATGTGVAHFAHLGGLIFGFLLIMYWKKTHQLYSGS